RHENILRRGAISLLFRMRPESSLPVTKTSSQKESLKLEHHRAPCLFAAALTTSQHGRACRDSWSGRFRSNLRRRSCRARIPLRAGAVATGLRPVFNSGFSLRVPLMDTTIYLDYLAGRFEKAGGEIHARVRFEKLEEADRDFDLVINCAGIGARELVRDTDL